MPSSAEEAGLTWTDGAERDDPFLGLVVTVPPGGLAEVQPLWMSIIYDGDVRRGTGTDGSACRGFDKVFWSLSGTGVKGGGPAGEDGYP